MDNARIESEAKAGIYGFVARSLLFFVPGHRNETPKWVATGTAFPTRAGRAVILTAGHNVEDAIKGEPLRLGHHGSADVVDDVVAKVVPHPDSGVDVAAIALNERGTNAIADYLLDASMIATDDEVQDDRHAVVIGGFPCVLMQESKQRLAIGTLLHRIGFMSVTHGTNLQDPPRDDRGRFRVEWSVREMPDKTTLPMPEPHGISGGALWRFTRGRPGEIWAPSAGFVIGVPTSFWRPTRTEFAERASKWRAWFLHTLDAIDGDVPWQPRAPLQR